MAFTAITSSEIEAGKPVRNDTATKIKDNFDDHESRIGVIETGLGTTYPPMLLTMYGNYHRYRNGSTIYPIRSTTNFDITVTGVRLIIFTAGSSGTTTVNVEYKRGGGAWTPILSTPASVAFGAGDNAVSSNAVIDTANDNLEAGDLIRVSLSSSQTDGIGFQVRIDYSKT
jgi:hypothetical protein